MPDKTIVSSDKPVCLVGGAPIEKDAISAVFSHVDAFVGVDGGANHLLAADVTPDAVIGDLDSLSDLARATFADLLHQVTDQSTTDFEKALTRIVAPLIFAIGFTGGRLDHTLSVLNVIAQHPDRAVILLDKDDVSFLAHIGTTAFDLARSTRISVMPLGVAVVSVSGVQWPFTAQRMAPDGFTSPSNAALGGQVTIETDGPVLVTLPRAFWQIAAQAAVRAR